MQRYNPRDIETKWQEEWDKSGIYTVNLNSSKPKYVAMSMFNYPSGAGIHIGHAMTYTISDVKARFKRQLGYESYHPVGWDAFGLPAENYAIKAGVSPQKSMATIIPSYHKQYKAMGWSNDWTKEISTHEPEYYRWTQWIFAQMFKQGLAYQDARMQWWCEKCQTVLANEQVIDGKCWRHDGSDEPTVEKKEVKQWFFKITEYAEELLDATDALDWTESVKLAQKNWIGKSQGAEVEFEIEDKNIEHFVLLHGKGGASDLNFFPWLKKYLEIKGYTVEVPDLPDSNEPNDEIQTEFVIKNCRLDDKTAVIGHSFGGIVALRLLESGKKLAKVVLAGTPHTGTFLDGKTRPSVAAAVEKGFQFELIKNNCPRIIALYDSEDSVVATSDGKQFATEMDCPLIITKSNHPHFCSDQEPEIIKAIFRNIKVFTTRPDTLFGATFMVLAPEHELVNELSTQEQKTEVGEYVKVTQTKTEVERQASKEKTGVFTGAYATNPVNGEKIPVWIADYVLPGYGTGAIMAVPAHDERDYEFAKKFDLPILQVVASYEVYGGANTPREDVETLRRNTVDAIIVDKAGKTLLQTEGEQVHFVGGGIDSDDADPEAAIRREVREETGYINIASIRQVAPTVAGIQFRHTKGKNQQGAGAFYEVILENGEKVHCEADEGKHTLQWVDREKVADLLTWSWHLDGWQYYLNEDVPHTYFGEGILINSGRYNFIPSSEAREKIVTELSSKGVATAKINYKMRDWSVSRQRYWGAPIPIINCPKDGPILVADDKLPVVLPVLDDFQPSGDGRSALARATEWLKVTCPTCGCDAERETDTLDTYIDSSWYMYRYFDSHNSEAIFDPAIAKMWEPIDFYNGADHATAHLLYARFVARFLSKQGLINNPEPFKQFLFNGKVTAADGQMFSKSKGNGVDPLEIIEQGYGADALRTYLMFAAPLDLWAKWDPQGVPGTYRFLNRVWNLVQEFLAAPEGLEGSQDKELMFATHAMIKKMTEDIEENRYNTAIATAMGTLNEFYKLKIDNLTQNDTWRFAVESLVSCIAPFAPHMAEELWHQLGHENSVHTDSWPRWDAAHLVTNLVTIVVQINGKVRAELEIAPSASEQDVLDTAQKNDKVAGYLAGHEIKKTIYIPGKLVSFVV